MFDTSSKICFKYQIFPIPVPRLLFGKFFPLPVFKYRFQEFVPYQIFPISVRLILVPNFLFRYQIFPIVFSVSNFPILVWGLFWVIHFQIPVHRLFSGTKFFGYRFQFYKKKSPYWEFLVLVRHHLRGTYVTYSEWKPKLG